MERDVLVVLGGEEAPVEVPGLHNGQNLVIMCIHEAGFTFITEYGMNTRAFR